MISNNVSTALQILSVPDTVFSKSVMNVKVLLRAIFTISKLNVFEGEQYLVRLMHDSVYGFDENKLEAR